MKRPSNVASRFALRLVKRPSPDQQIPEDAATLQCRNAPPTPSALTTVAQAQSTIKSLTDCPAWFWRYRLGDACDISDAMSRLVEDVIRLNRKMLTSMTANQSLPATDLAQWEARLDSVSTDLAKHREALENVRPWILAECQPLQLDERRPAAAR
jgi:hypothetical protein